MFFAGTIVDAVTNTLAAIPFVASAMTVAVPSGTQVRISGFHYEEGATEPLQKAVYEMPAPSILVAWMGTKGGPFAGNTCWKHRIAVHIRMGNAAGQMAPVDYEKLWYHICQDIPTGQTTNIRYMQFDPYLDIMDTPTIEHMTDEEGIDRFMCTFVIPEIGDF